jgi:hypothetical protein
MQYVFELLCRESLEKGYLLAISYRTGRFLRKLCSNLWRDINNLRLEAIVVINTIYYLHDSLERI